MWWPFVFTLFVGFVFLDPVQRDAGRVEWVLTILGVVAFFALYAAGLAYWSRRKIALLCVAGVTLLGLLFAPYNLGAAIFIIFATSFVPFVVRGDARASAGIIASIVAVVALESWLVHLSWVFPAYSAGYALILGVGNTYAARQTFATERLAQLDERERIARDLHDVLGHTLSVIVLKAELAGRLLERDLERAKTEIADVERITREALAEVRQAILGYRAGSLADELERSRSTLETAGLTVMCQTESMPLSPDEESVLALVMREAVTNVVRHARARSCRLEVRQVNGARRLEVEDDGRGGSHVEGSGIRGMRERVEALGGRFVQEGNQGTKLTITLPAAGRAQDVVS